MRDEPCVYAIDASSQGLAIACVELDGEINSVAYYPLVHPKHAHALNIVKGLDDHLGMALFVIEDSMGPHAKAVAVVHRIIGACLAAAPEMELLNTSTWKKATVGRGNATKEMVKAWCLWRYPDLQPDLRQDEYDAIGIAAAYALMNAKEFARPEWNG
jgi:Holliday junction resolvasome RuvABC endonuclease subunit